VLWPAWFRFRHYFPEVPHPDIFFGIVLADSLILVAALRDWFVHRRVHFVWLIGGSAPVTENIIEAVFFDTPAWRSLAHVLYGFFAP
jgi:hypothetical protein